MARNGSGVYTLPPGSTVSNGDTSDATDVNTPLADLETDMNTARPIVAGGTGATSAAAALVNLGLTATAAELNALDGITATVAELNILDGVTATAAELNALDGITATVTELNYTDGVTSAIQTQMNLKAPLASPTFTGAPAAPTAAAGTDTTQLATTAFAKTVAEANSIGVGQTWQDMSASRTGSTSYQNTTGKPIMVAVTDNLGSSPYYQVSTDNVAWVDVGRIGSNSEHSFSFIVPDDHYYRINGAISETVWAELR